MRVLILFFIFTSCATHYPPLDINNKQQFDNTIREILLQRINDFRECYNFERAKYGTEYAAYFNTKFKIQKSGFVSDVEFIKFEATNEFKKCFEFELKATKFPSVVGEKALTIKQPFNFYPRRGGAYPKIDFDESSKN